MWEAHDGCCYWCDEPAEFKEVTVDHVIPEHLLDHPDQLEDIRVKYGLGPAFDINSFFNWVPAHDRCNRNKAGTLFRASPAMVAFLEHVAKRAPHAARRFATLQKNQTKARIIAHLESAIADNTVTQADIESLFEGVAGPARGSTLPAQLKLDGRWVVVRQEGKMAYVSDGQRFGMRPIGPDIDASWRCGFCGCYGPWNGVICLTCGHRSCPDD